MAQAGHCLDTDRPIPVMLRSPRSRAIPIRIESQPTHTHYGILAQPVNLASSFHVHLVGCTQLSFKKKSLFLGFLGEQNIRLKRLFKAGVRNLDQREPHRCEPCQSDIKRELVGHKSNRSNVEDGAYY